MDRGFMDRQLAVIFEQMRVVKDLLEKMEMRLEEMEYELEEPIDFKVGFDWADDDYDLMDYQCDCEFCRGEDRGHRMD